MPQKFLTIFLSAIFVYALLLPGLALAEGSYKADFYQDCNKNGRFDKETESANSIVDKNISYEGFVPCGVDVCVGGKMLNGSCYPASAGAGSLPPSINNKCASQPAACPSAVNWSDPCLLPREANYCQLCHSFVMANNIVNYLVIKIVPILAVLMLVVAGAMLYFGGANPGLLSRSKTLIKGIVIGLVLIYGSYILINTFLLVLGAAEINSVKQIFSNGVFSVKCPVHIPLLREII